MNSWNSIEFEYPAIPTMISLEETQYLFWIGAHYWKKIGHIVEIGPWLGGSTICLASGMRNGDTDGKYRLHTFDNFVWHNFMASRASLPLRDGDSFQAYFENNLSSFSALLHAHRSALPDDTRPLDKLAESIHTNIPADIPALTWELAEPVEILFVDGAKSWTGFRHLLQTFNEALIPGKSLLVLQDYKFWGSYWVPMMLEFFMEHFELEHIVAQNTVSFIFKSKIPAEKFTNLPDYDGMEVSMGNSLLEKAGHRLMISGDRLGAYILRASKVRFGLNMGTTEYTLDLFRKLEAEWPMGMDCQTISRLRNWLQQETGHRLTPTIRWQYVSTVEKIRNRARNFIRRVLARVTPAVG